MPDKLSKSRAELLPKFSKPKSQELHFLQAVRYTIPARAGKVSICEIEDGESNKIGRLVDFEAKIARLLGFGLGRVSTSGKKIFFWHTGTHKQ
jgi:hypothetical protein